MKELLIEKYGKKKRNISISEEEDDIEKNITKKNIKRKFDVDLEVPNNEDKNIPPYSVNLGNGVTVEVKEFRKKHYIAFSKMAANDTDYRNRLNIELSQLPTLQKALDIISSYIKNC